MKRLKTVFLFEFNELIKKKSMLISTLIISLIFLVSTFAPRIISSFGSNMEDDTNIPTESFIDFSTTVVVAEDEALLSELKEILISFETINFSNNLEETKNQILNEDYETAYIMKNLTSYTVLKKDTGIDFSDDMFSNILRETQIFKNYQDKGIDILDVTSAQDVQIDVEYETLGKDALQGIAFGFVSLFALYLLILLYGQLVATSVAREKDSRTMELLITSTNPKTLIVGKVLAAGLVGFIQVAIIILVGFIGFKINQNTYPEFIVDLLLGGASLDVMLVYLVFSFTGYLLYLFIYASLGSLVSKVEDVGSAVSSITVVFVIAYLIASSAMSAPDTTIVRVSSYVPFVSLFTMPIRYMMTSVPTIQLVISLVLMMVTILIVAYISIYIYRKGSLNYGNRISLIKVLKSSFKK